MVKKSLYICQQCSYESTGWLGKCPECGTWNSLVETITPFTKTTKRRTIKSKGVQKPVLLSKIPPKKTKRLSTRIPELDRVLGGGIVDGQVILIAGEPGIGKSTILLQLVDKLGNALYVSGEESVSQIKIRADRLKVKKKTIQIMEETNIESIINTVELLTNKNKNSPATTSYQLSVLIIDSIQTMVTSDLSGMAGSVGQVRECAYRLVRLAKSKNIPIIIVGHVTKEGAVAGPAVLMHIVDTVLWFEGDKSQTLRLLRAVKNRFGATDEVGIFTMENQGLISQSNEKAFLTKGRVNVPGSITTSIMQGTRLIPVEIQSLVVSTKLVYPRRIAQGIDSKKLELLLAVLQRRCGLKLHEYDAFVNVVGGITVRNDPSVDLAISLSLASSYFDKSLAKSTIAIGEVGLLGEIREVIAQEKRIKESKRLGYKNIIASNKVKYLKEAIKTYLQ